MPNAVSTMESVRRKPNTSGFAKFKKSETAESNFRRAYVTDLPSAKSVPWFTRLKGIESFLKKAPLRTPQNCGRDVIEFAMYKEIFSPS